MKTTTALLTATAITAVMALTGCGGGGDNGDPFLEGYTPHPYDTPPLDEGTKAAYLNAINAARSVGRDCGRFGHFDPAPPLQWSDAAYRAAKEHSNDMAASGVFDHIGSNTASDWTAQVQDLGYGSNPSDRIRNNFTTPKMDGHSTESIAMGFYDVKEVINAWLGSAPHCAGVMDPAVQYVGMAEADAGGYWTLFNYSER